MSEASSPELSLIAPTYKESENVPILASRVHEALRGVRYELIVVDDNSPDGTAQIAEGLSKQYPIRVLCRKDERGLATAVVAGFGLAHGQVLGVIDADLQHPPEEIPRLLQAIRDGADVSIGSRYVPGGGVEGWTFSRRVMSRGAGMFSRIFLRSARHVKDPMSGFFLLRKEAIDGVELKPIGYKILLEVIARGKVNKVTEVPYVFKERERGKSKLNMREQKTYLQHVFRLASDEGGIKKVFRPLAGGSK